jgi:predicted nucleic-acid-binding protein
MIGIDTNVLLRLFMGDDIEQLQRAQACFAEAAEQGPIHVNAVVLSEFAWTLAKGFKIPRGRLAAHIEDLLAADDVDVMYRPAAAAAVQAFRAGRADYPDYYLAEINAIVGCTKTVTFDKDALDHARFAPVP